MINLMMEKKKILMDLLGNQVHQRENISRVPPKIDLQSISGTAAAILLDIPTNLRTLLPNHLSSHLKLYKKHMEDSRSTFLKKRAWSDQGLSIKNSPKELNN